MRVEILDVGHGLCAWAQARDGSVVVVDCGSGPEKPSLYLPRAGCRRIESLFVTNYDEDHITDLPGLIESLPISVLYRNKTVSPEALHGIKREGGPITPAMAALLGMMREYTGEVTSTPPLPGITFRLFHTQYPTQFTDTNNLSLVVFLDVGNATFLFPGDLECVGWQALLKQPGFCEALRRVDVFIASHHGRESGYCREVFAYCRPEFIVFSDSPVRCATQEMASCYAQHARGGWFTSPSGRELRKVLSTRSDGRLHWTPE